MKIWRMAFRHILRNRRRSLITILAMAFSLGIMVVYIGLTDGMTRDTLANAILLDMGHVQVHAPQYLDSRSLYDLIENPEELAAKLESAGFQASPRVFASGLCAKGESSMGVVLRGIDPVRESRTTRLPHHLLEGRWLNTADPRGVVLGKRLALSLSARIGDTVVIVSQAADGSLANELFTVRGVLKAVSDSVDRAGFFITIDAFREFMVLPKGVHEIVVTTPEGVDLAKASQEVARLCPGLDVRTWKKLAPALGEMIAAMDVWLLISVAVTYIAVAIVILNAMLMAVFERIHEYGITKALGVGPWNVFVLVMVEIFILSSAAAVLGLASGIPLTLWLETHGIDMSAFIKGGSLSGVAIDLVWRSMYSPRIVYAPLVFLYLFSLLAGIYPAAKAARLNPVQAIHHF